MPRESAERVPSSKPVRFQVQTVDQARSRKIVEALELISMAVNRLFVKRIALVSSFGAESSVLLHLVSRIDRSVPVIFLDTEMHFPETLEYRETLTKYLGLQDVRVIRPDPTHLDRVDPDGTLCRVSPDLCCRVRKVVPLEKALAPFDAWINGRKRSQSEGRSSLRFLEADRRWVKFNPLADWLPKDIETYKKHHDLPRHPLVDAGFGSIGCAPCTKPTHRDEDQRAGRWPGKSKTECGIHFSADGNVARERAPQMGERE
ncbi:MAG: phosphoadenylyl-sulfate reductase [Pseudomonadota bacterium]